MLEAVTESPYINNIVTLIMINIDIDGHDWNLNPARQKFIEPIKHNP